jgi:3',5'-cyclic AMP phosphodiesterase CpdA
MRVAHTWTKDTARIRVEGVEARVRMYHCTDMHLAVPDAEGAPDRARHDDIVAMAHAREHLFRATIGGVADREVDLVALTGDIVNFPTASSVSFVAEVLDGLGIPTLYTSGNHDWLLPRLADEDGALREAYWDRLEPLHKGCASHSHRQLGGIDFIAVDNSTFRVNEAQVAFVRAILEEGRPSVLLYHIPLSLPTLREDAIAAVGHNLMADPDWHPAHEWWDPQANAAFVELLCRAPNLVATFCGHIHIPHADTLSPTAIQYVGPPGFEGYGRMVEFRPW